MKNLLKILLLSIVLISCGDTEPIIYDNINGQTLAFFDTTSSSLEVIIDDVGSVDVEIGMTTLSSTDRTVIVSIVPETTTAAADTYSFNPSVIIPANSYFGSLTITGEDNNVETTAELITLKIESLEGGGVASSATHAISIFQICPIEATAFSGMYLIEQTSPFVDGPTLDDGTIVNVSVGSSSTSRVFATARYVWYCSTPMDFNFNLVCNEIVVPLQDTNCSCGDPQEWFGPASTPEVYDPNDDSVFYLTFSDDLKSNCGPTAQTTYKFTKQ